jgi:hypothetical protein
VLNQDNPLFGGFGTTPAAAEYRPSAGAKTLPVIPLVSPLRGVVEQPQWPVVDPAATGALKDLLETRLRSVAERLGAQSGLPCDGILAGLIAQWGAGYGGKKISEAETRQNGLG